MKVYCHHKNSLEHTFLFTSSDHLPLRSYKNDPKRYLYAWQYTWKFIAFLAQIFQHVYQKLSWACTAGRCQERLLMTNMTLFIIITVSITLCVQNFWLPTYTSTKMVPSLCFHAQLAGIHSSKLMRNNVIPYGIKICAQLPYVRVFISRFE